MKSKDVVAAIQHLLPDQRCDMNVPLVRMEHSEKLCSEGNTA